MDGKIRAYLADNSFLAGVMFSALYWVFEACADTLIFSSGGFLEALLPSDGHELWMRVTAVFILMGFSICVHAIVARRKQAEELLREERDRAQKYLDVAGVIFVILDVDKRVMLINRKGCSVLGYSEGEIIGKDWFEEFLPENVRPQTAVFFEKLVKGEVEPAEFKYHENPVVTKDGTEKLIAWHNTVLRDKNGFVTALLSSGEDITERRAAEDALKERVEELERFRKATVERELRMQKLKERVFELENKNAADASRPVRKQAPVAGRRPPGT